ncbi:tRNA-queuosine alpha-mannosyltransferase domain-containing protein [Desulfobacter sp.]
MKFLKILFLEPFYGGSHKAVADGFAACSRHQVDILSLAPRFWKWRMRGSALAFIRQVKNLTDYDLVFATDMVDVTDFKALAGPQCPPVAFYFHENQLSYPLEPGEKRDFHLGFTNIISALAADQVFFNSKFHRDDFFSAAKSLIRKMPDLRPGWVLDNIRSKTGVLYPGIELDPKVVVSSEQEKSRLDRPLVIWNHRWEYDKNPKTFFTVLERLKRRGILFYLAVMGEQYDSVPEAFKGIDKRFDAELLVCGYQEQVADYRKWLAQGRVVISTAIQENFGISVMEAVAHACFPLLPNRLSYPELIPERLKSDVIYHDDADLEAKLERILVKPDAYQDKTVALAAHAERFSWVHMAQKWDEMLCQTGESGRRRH